MSKRDGENYFSYLADRMFTKAATKKPAVPRIPEFKAKPIEGIEEKSAGIEVEESTASDTMRMRIIKFMKGETS
jgi:hypothetical protein